MRVWFFLTPDSLSFGAWDGSPGVESELLAAPDSGFLQSVGCESVPLAVDLCDLPVALKREADAKSVDVLLMHSVRSNQNVLDDAVKDSVAVHQAHQTFFAEMTQMARSLRKAAGKADLESVKFSLIASNHSRVAVVEIA